MCSLKHILNMYLVHSSVSGHIGCFLVTVNDVAVWEHRCLFSVLILIPLDIHLDVEFLHHTEILFLMFSRISILLYNIGILIYSATNSVQEFTSLALSIFFLNFEIKSS